MDKKSQKLRQPLDKHGGDIYRNLADYDFSVNTNPLGMPREAIEAAKEGIMLSGRYPDSEGEALRRALSNAEDVAMEQILLGNGAAELIYALCRVICQGGGQRVGLIPVPSFGEYEEALFAAGGCAKLWRLEEPDSFQLNDKLLETVTEEVSLLFLCSPNNPTGMTVERELLEEIAKACEKRGVWLCLDECFLPFLEEEPGYTMKGRLERYPHLLVLRAFTKIYGMAGLRLGYAMTANAWLRERMRRCLPPWNTSIPAQMAGIKALEDTAYLARSRALLLQEKAYLLRELSEGLAEKIYPGKANFILFQSRRDLKELLLKKRILIRSCGNFQTLTDAYFRIGIRTHEANEELIRRWRQAVKEGEEL